jgi:hypothetical protein
VSFGLFRGRKSMPWRSLPGSAAVTSVNQLENKLLQRPARGHPLYSAGRFARQKVRLCLASRGGNSDKKKFFRRIVFFCHIPGMLCVNSNEGEAVKKILRTIYQSGSLLAGLLHLAGSLLAGLKSLNISAAPFRSSNNSRRVWLAPTFGQSCVSWVW